MRIIDMVNYNFADATAKTQKEKSKTDSVFGMMVSEAGRRQKSFDPSVRENRNETRPNRERSRTNETVEQSTRRRNTQAEETSSAGAAAVHEPVTVDETTTEPDIINEQEAIAKIAEILDVPQEVVMEWLQELDLDIADLSDTQAVAKLIQHALSIETPAELLTNEKFPTLLKAVNEVIENEVIEEENVVLEELEVSVENGKVVISNRNENTSDNSQQQTTSETEQNIETVTELPPEVTEEKIIIPHEINNNEVININTEATIVKAEQVVKQTATPLPVDTANVIEQIMNQVKVTASGGQFNEIRMTLRPETLGDIVLRVITQNGIVTAQFEAESQRVKEALEADFNMLRNALEQQGIKFSELSVSVRQDENERMSQFEHARQRSRHRAETIKSVSEAELPEEVSYHSGVIDVTA